MTREFPFDEVPPLEVWDRVRAGERLPIPLYCPTPYADLIRLCWDANPKKRPTWDHIFKTLKSIKEGHAQAIEDTFGADEDEEGEGLFASFSSVEVKKLAVECGGREFLVDDPTDVKRASVRNSINLANSPALMMSLPPYVVATRMTTTVFKYGHFEQGVKAYEELDRESLSESTVPDLSLMLVNKQQGKLSHIFLYDKNKVGVGSAGAARAAGAPPPSASPASRRLRKKKVYDLVEGVVERMCTPCICVDLESLYFPCSDMDVKYASVSTVSLQKTMKTVASGIYVKTLVPWAMKGKIWKGGLSLTNYQSGRTVLVNFFKTEEEMTEFMSGGSFHKVLETLGSFLDEYPVVCAPASASSYLFFLLCCTFVYNCVGRGKTEEAQGWLWHQQSTSVSIAQVSLLLSEFITLDRWRHSRY